MENYLLFDKTIKGLNTAPFEATKKLLDLLEISYECVNEGKEDIGFEQRFLDTDKFYDIFKPTLLKAKEEKKSIIALESSSYLGLHKAKEALDIDVGIISSNDLVFEKIQTKEIKNSFKEFNAGIFYGDNGLDQSAVSELLKFTEAKEINLLNAYENDAFSLMELDEDMALKMSGDILFEAFDNGCDFLVVNDIRSFSMFDTNQDKIQKIKKRPFGENGFAVLSISQVLLMALGKVKMDENLTDKHKIKPDFI